MTIEAALAALTAAVEANTAALKGAKAAAPVDSPKQDKPVDSPKAAAPVDSPKQDKPAAGAQDYDSVKVPFLKLVKTNRDKALGILKEFGVESLKEAKPEQFGAILAKIQAASA